MTVARVKVVCARCGGLFEKRQSEIDRSARHYCSRSCGGTARSYESRPTMKLSRRAAVYAMQAERRRVLLAELESLRASNLQPEELKELRSRITGAKQWGDHGTRIK